MSTYLLVLSLALHLFTILWIVTYMQKIQNKLPLENNSEKIKSEIEDLLIAYTTEIKEENEKLALELKEWKRSKAKPQESALPDFDAAVEGVKSAGKKRPSMPLNRKVVNAYTAPKNKPSTPPKEPDSDLLPLLEEEQTEKQKVLFLAKQGVSAAEIAKKLNMGKGEVELLLKFYQ